MNLAFSCVLKADGNIAHTQAMAYLIGETAAEKSIKEYA